MAFFIQTPFMVSQMRIHRACCIRYCDRLVVNDCDPSCVLCDLHKCRSTDCNKKCIGGIHPYCDECEAIITMRSASYGRSNPVSIPQQSYRMAQYGYVQVQMPVIPTAFLLQQQLLEQVRQEAVLASMASRAEERHMRHHHQQPSCRRCGNGLSQCFVRDGICADCRSALRF